MCLSISLAEIFATVVNGCSECSLCCHITACGRAKLLLSQGTWKFQKWNRFSVPEDDIFLVSLSIYDVPY
jgi:hypothetical protein